jgi:hypothetical protein
VAAKEPPAAQRLDEALERAEPAEPRRDEHRRRVRIRHPVAELEALGGDPRALAEQPRRMTPRAMLGVDDEIDRGGRVDAALAKMHAPGVQPDAALRRSHAGGAQREQYGALGRVLDVAETQLGVRAGAVVSAQVGRPERDHRFRVARIELGDDVTHGPGSSVREELPLT